ncbi:hypothetical protein BC374_16960 [Ensifer sp. LC13]|nr:hypothetical protein BC362_27710 [Ensifer sp. LC14]OCP11361.1 hypothetical protein BC374_16960 [Ensifer sp. LC13]OCP11996.1 hypothetical protein BBX50_17360 [Ensifer sp. LC11]OCP33505.1 hypothetical protein BC364_16255 [Ensifer sp. LC499]
MPFGGLLGDLSAAICTAIWFPDRRGLGEERTEQAASVRGLMRVLLMPALPHRPSRRSVAVFSPPPHTCLA